MDNSFILPTNVNSFTLSTPEPDLLTRNVDPILQSQKNESQEFFPSLGGGDALTPFPNFFLEPTKASELEAYLPSLTDSSSELETLADTDVLTGLALSEPYVSQDSLLDASATTLDSTDSTSPAFTFDGDDYISIPLDVPETEATHEFWFKTTDPEAGLFTVVNKDLGRGGHDRHLYLSNGNLKTRLWSTEVIGSQELDLADGQWHHVAHVFGESVGGQKLYVDGELVATGNKSASDFDWQKHLNLGFSNDARSKYLKGSIDEVRVWGKARTQAEIQADLNRQLTGTESGLIGYWRLDEGTGTTITDATGNGNEGTVQGETTWVTSDLATSDPNANPVLVQNNPLVLDENRVATITSSLLAVTDEDNTTSEITYTLETIPTNGVIKLNEIELRAGDSFTQADLETGLLSYQHDGSDTTSDGFTFTVADGAGGSIETTSFTIDVTPVADEWTASFINLTQDTFSDYQNYDFSNPDAVLNLGSQHGVVYEETPFESLEIHSIPLYTTQPVGDVIYFTPDVQTNQTTHRRSSITGMSSVLEEGVHYRIEVSGTWEPIAGHSHLLVDARFVTTDTWATYNDLYDGITELGLLSTALGASNDEFWGEYQQDHVYTYEIVGQGEAVDFYVSDTNFEDNEGAYTVKIYREAEVEPTTDGLKLEANFGYGSPNANVQDDYFGMEAWTSAYFEAGQVYQVTTGSDDGTRFFLENAETGQITLVGDEWRNRSANELATTHYFQVAESGEYNVYVQYYEAAGASSIDVEINEAPFDSLEVEPTSSSLGKPVSNPYQIGDSTRQDFERGLAIESEHGSFPVYSNVTNSEIAFGNWKPVTDIPERATDIGVGADGSVWVIGKATYRGERFHGNGNHYEWVPYQIKYGDTLSHIALRTMGRGIPSYYNWIAAHNNIANPSQIRTNQWIQVPQLVSNPNSGGGIYRWNGSSWEQKPGRASRIAVEPDGTPWVVNDGGAIYRATETSWQQMPGHARDIGVGADGSVWIIGVDNVPGGHSIHQWNGNGWTRKLGGAVKVTVESDGTPWIVNDGGAIYRGTETSWQQMPGRARDIGVGANDTVWITGIDNVGGGHSIHQWDGSDWVQIPGGATQVAVEPDGSAWVVNDNGHIFNYQNGIGEKYLSLGAENSFLGVPISKEYVDADGYTRQDFEGGYILYRADGKAIAYDTQALDTLPVDSGNGSSAEWTVQFWDNKTLSGSPKWTTTQPAGEIRFLAGSGAPVGTKGIPEDNFSARWETNSYFEGGFYNFISNADDGMKVYIDGVLVNQKWAAVNPWERHDAYVAIPEGNHHVRVDYFEQGGTAGLTLRWEDSGLLEGWTGDFRPVGFDGTSVHGTYVQTYQRNGEIDELGYPLNNVHPWENGYTQNFEGGTEGRGAIMKSNANDNSYWVGGEVWDAFLNLGGAESLGYPTTDYIEINGGLNNLEDGGGIVQHFSGNVGIPAKIWLSQHGAHPTWGAIGGRYEDLGGANSFLGFPTSGETGIDDGWVKQTFENGYLLWHPNNGTTAYDTQSVNNLPPDNGRGTTDKWHVQYWNNHNLEGESVWSEYQETSQIRFHAGRGAPLGTRGVKEDNFSVRWTTTSYFDGGLYHFFNKADDGIRIYIDDELIIDKWKDSGFEGRDALHAIEQGYHDVRVEYYEHGGIAANTLSWIRRANPNQWIGEFYNNTNLSGSAVQPEETLIPLGNRVILFTDTQSSPTSSDQSFTVAPVDSLLGGSEFLDKDWGTGHEAGLPLGNDNFSNRWRKVHEFDEPGLYKFSSNSDDGIRVWVDGNLVLDAWDSQTVVHPPRDYQPERFPGNGQYYEWQKYEVQLGDTLYKIAEETMGSGDATYSNWIAQRNDLSHSYRLHVGQPIEVPNLVDVPDYNALVSLDKGFHVIQVEHYEKTGNAYNQLSWEKVAGEHEKIGLYYPQVFDPDTNGQNRPPYILGDWQEPWLMEFFNNTGLQGSPVITKTFDSVAEARTKGFDFNWGLGSPDAVVNSDQFSARLTTHRSFIEGTYQFNLQSDDGVRLSINGEEIVDRWTNPPFEPLEVEVILPRGVHEIQLEYQESVSDAYINFDWDLVGASPGYSNPGFGGRIYKPSISRRVIPSSSFGSPYEVATNQSDTVNENFLNAYEQLVEEWGDSFIGVPISNLNEEWVSPYVPPGMYGLAIVDLVAITQEFRGEKGAGAILMKPDEGRSRIISSDGSNLEPQSGDRDPVYVFGKIWEFYEDAGGVGRFGHPLSLGYPVSSQKDLGNGAYELELPNGKIFYKPGMTNATYYEYVDGGLTTPADAWRGEYFNNRTHAGDPVVVRADSASDGDLNESWSDRSPAPGVTADNFSVRWTSQQDFERGTYRFKGTHDDDFQVTVNGQNPIQRAGVGIDINGYGTFTREGQYALEVKQVEYGGLAYAKMSYEKASDYVVGLDANNNPNQTLIDHFNGKGGYSQLGVPINNVYGQHRGVVQEFDGGSLGKNALIKSNIDGKTYHLTGGYYQVWKSANLGTPTSEIIGYKNGITYRYFDHPHPDLGRVSAVDSQYGTYPLIGGIRGYYVSKGGLGSPLGAPKSGEYHWNNYTRQDFVGGYILWNGSATAYNNNGSLMFPPPSSGGGGGSGGSVTYDDYLQRLYKDNVGNLVTWNYEQHGDAIDSVDGESDRRVYALADGKVTYTRQGITLDRRNGKYYLPGTNTQVSKPWNYNSVVSIYNAELDRTFTYIHFRNIKVKQGAYVNAGDLIGIEGNTGYVKGVTGIHTHVAVKKSNGSHENPLVTLAILDSSNDGGGGGGNKPPGSTQVVISSVTDAGDGDNIVFAGDSILVYGQTYTSNLQFYLGDKELVEGTANYLTDGAFSIKLKIPHGNSYLGNHRLKVVANNESFYSPNFVEVISRNSDYLALLEKEKEKAYEYPVFFQDGDFGHDFNGSVTWQMDAKEMLGKYKDFLLEAANFYGVDGRAIAGAIRWEYEENWPSRVLDRFSYWWVKTSDSWFLNGTGWGKMHYSTARKYLQNYGNEGLAKRMAYAPTAIDLIAREMRSAIDAYRDYAGVDISKKPEIIAHLYNTGNFEEKAKDLGFLRKKYPTKEPQLPGGKYIDVNDLSFEIPTMPVCTILFGCIDPPDMPVGEIWKEKMGWWVTENLNDLEEFKTV